jgi:hypothetical protein
MAANRFGKTECGADEMSYHLSGQYPLDWPGKRFDKPVRAWAAGVTSETTRDVVQAKLIGPPFTEAEWGQGMVPKSCIADIAPARGIPAAIDTVSIKHVSGGTSALQFKSFERGRTPGAAGYLAACTRPAHARANSAEGAVTRLFAAVTLISYMPSRCPSKKDSPKKLAGRMKRRWRVVLLRAIGQVEAHDVASAKAAAVVQFDVDEIQRNRIMVRDLG